MTTYCLVLTITSIDESHNAKHWCMMAELANAVLRNDSKIHVRGMRGIEGMGG